jgi:hypothetical protein
MNVRTVPPRIGTPGVNFDRRLKEIGMFFQGESPVHQTMNRLAAALEKAHIPYAIVGGMAVNAHGHHRTTNDLDILLTATGLAEFRRLFVPAEFDPVPRRPRRFTDKSNSVTVDIFITGRYPGSGQPGPIAYPAPDDASETIDNKRVVNLVTLVTLKLAARRYQDFADVVSLIRVHDLDETFAGQLPSSLHRDYLECLDEKRREDEYEAREAREAED